MTTTIEMIKIELAANKISFTGCNEAIPAIVLNLIEKIKHFGIGQLKESNLGSGVKKVVRKLEKKDTRVCVTCPITLKDILV